MQARMTQPVLVPSGRHEGAAGPRRRGRDRGEWTPRRCLGVHVSDGRIAIIDMLVDPERIGRLDLSGLDTN